jgi:hypothetical protein
LIGSLLSGKPVISAKLAAFGWRNLADALKRHGPFDAVVCNSAPVAGAFPEMFAAYPTILLTHNVEHLSARQNATQGGLFNRLLYVREARLLQAVETTSVRAARHVWCVTEEDRDWFGADIRDKSSILPVLPPPTPNLPAAEPAHDVGLIGTWTWQPNLIGLRWFLDEIAPRLPDDISVAIAGRMPDGVQSSRANVRLLGRVPDAAIFVASSRVIALASRSGTGVLLKTIETFQHGKPAVATNSAVRGVPQLPGNCLVADDAPGFAAALVKLVRDVRAERTGMADGSGFVAHQQAAIDAAIRTGLAALDRKA